MSKMLKNTSLYTIGNILPQAAGFLLLPIYTRYLSPADYGIVSSMQVLSIILTLTFTFAIDRSVYRLYFDYKKEKEKKDYLGTITISILAISLIVLSLLFAFRGAIGHIYSTISFHPFYTYAILTTFFNVFAIIPKIYFQLNEKAGKFVLCSMSQFVLITGFVLWFIVKEKEGATGMLKGQMIANIIMSVVFAFISFRTINFTFSTKILKESLSFSLPMIPALLSAWILNLSDRIFIERYFDLHEVGIYSMAYKIASILLIITGAFTAAYNPVFYKLANSEDQVTAKNKISKYNDVYIKVILLGTIAISLFSKEFIQFFLAPKYHEAYKIVPLIIFAYLISQISGLFNIMIYQQKKVTRLMIVGLIGAAVNILLNYLFIPTFGVYGAAYATILSFIIIFVLSHQVATKCYYIPLLWKSLFIYTTGAIIAAALFGIIELGIIVTILLKIVTLAIFIYFLIIKRKKELLDIFHEKK